MAIAWLIIPAINPGLLAQEGPSAPAARTKEYFTQQPADTPLVLTSGPAAVISGAGSNWRSGTWRLEA